MRKFPDNAHLSLNSFIIHISLPALIIVQIHHVSLRPEHPFSIAMPWIMFSIGAGFFWVLSARLHFSRETTGALMLSGGLANTSFVGLPMIEAFFGASSMATGILIDQLGTYLVLSTLGVTVATIYSASWAEPKRLPALPCSRPRWDRRSEARLSRFNMASTRRWFP
jgi:malate permease and related proteins